MPQLGRRPAAHCARRRGHKGRKGSQTGGHWSAWYMENRRMRLLEYRDELWDAPLLFGGLMVLLTVEWILRKRSRMA